MRKHNIILSMTTWPPRFSSARVVMDDIIRQRKQEGLEDAVHCVLVLSEEEVGTEAADSLISYMEEIGVEVIIDRGNIMSHKKLIPTLEAYPDAAILVVDDDNIQAPGWLRTFVQDHEAHPYDIIFGQGSSTVFACDGKIMEKRDTACMFMQLRGEVVEHLKPASGAAGTLYPAHTFTDSRFFDRELLMRTSPTSDETWQYAFAKIAGKTFRLLSACNIPSSASANQMVALYNKNRDIYSLIHNSIASAIPEYSPELFS